MLDGSSIFPEALDAGPLRVIGHGRTAKALPSASGRDDACFGSFNDQGSLVLSEGSSYLHEEAASRSAGVDGVVQGDEADSESVELAKDIESWIVSGAPFTISLVTTT